MKALNSIILIFLTVQLFGQGISHYQLDEPEIGTTSDSVLFFVRTGNYWSMVKGVMDTSQIEGLRDYIELIAPEQDLSSYSTKTQLGDTANVLRSEFPVYLVDLDSVGFTITESQISDLQDYLINSDLSGLRDSTLSNTGKDTTGIYHVNRALLDAIDVNDTTWWGQQPTLLTDLDSTGFDIDTTQVRNLKMFVENNSGEASISGTEGYIPKFGVSGLTESVVYEETSGSSTFLVAPNSAIFGNTEIRAGGGVIINNRGTGNRYAFVDFKGDDTYQSPLRIIRNNTGADAISDIIHRGTGGLRLRTIEAAPIQFYTTAAERMRITPTGNVGIGKTNPSEKLEVNGNIKADTVKAVLDTIYADKTSWSEFVGGSDLWTDNGTTLTATRGGVVVPYLNYGSYIQLTDPLDPSDNLYVSNSNTYNRIGNNKLAGFIIQKGNNPRVGYQGTYGANRMLFPYADGTSGQVLTTNGSGNMYWSDGGGGGGSGDITGVLTTTNSMITGGGTSGDITLVFDIDNAYIASSVASDNYMPISRNGNEEKVRLSTLANFFGSESGSMVYPSGSGIPTISSGSSWGTTITPSTGYLYYNGSSYSWSTPSGGGMVFPPAGIAVSTGSAWGTSITNNSSNWNTAYDDKINSLSVTGTTTKTITLTQQDGGTVSGTFTDLQGSGTSPWSTDTYGINYQDGRVAIGTSTSLTSIKLQVETSDEHYAIYGKSTASSAIGIYGESTTGYGIKGYTASSSHSGVFGESTVGWGVLGQSQNSYGVYAYSENDVGLLSTTNSATEYSAIFSGGLGVNSNKGYSANETEVIDSNGFTRPVSSTDTNAPNNSIYYSTTQSKLVYKDGSGTVHALY